MTRQVAVLIGCLVLAGCMGGPGPVSPTATEANGTPYLTTETPSDRGNLSFEYVIRSGGVPDSVSHVYMDFAVYVPEYGDDVYACTDNAPLFGNKYDPTATPVRTPAGDCTRFDVPRLDLATFSDSRTLGPYTVPARDSRGHTLVVHDVTVVLENGTTASDVYDTDFRAVTERTAPSGTYGVEISVTDYNGTDRDLPWRFGVEASRINASTS